MLSFPINQTFFREECGHGEISLAQEETQEQIKEETIALWRDTFHDAEPFIQLYFSRVFKPEYNIICQVDQHTVAALQALLIHEIL